MRDPASANSVQLARLDLYVPLDPPPTQPTSSLLGSVYELQAAARLAAEAGPGSAVSQSVSTLLRVLCNIVQHPSESKHTTLRMENAKIKAMLSGHTEILRLLRTIGIVLSMSCIALALSHICESVWSVFFLACSQPVIPTLMGISFVWKTISLLLGC